MSLIEALRQTNTDLAFLMANVTNLDQKVMQKVIGKWIARNRKAIEEHKN